MSDGVGVLVLSGAHHDVVKRDQWQQLAGSVRDQTVHQFWPADPRAYVKTKGMPEPLITSA